MEVFVDAMSGVIVHEAVRPTAEGGYRAEASALSFPMVVGVVLLAWLLVRRDERHATPSHHPTLRG